MLERDSDITVAGLIATRVHMTEGQLYTAILAIVAAVLLTLTGLPNAHRTTGSSTPPAPAVTVAPSERP